jgi:DNA-binding transcriptional ArsR family regulator
MPDETELTDGAVGESRWDKGALDADSSLDTLFRALADPTRRRVLGYLLEREEASFEELTDILVGWVASEGTVVGPNERERIEIGLYHEHLPVLADSDLVEYDTETTEVSLGTLPNDIAELIRLSNRYEREASADSA